MNKPNHKIGDKIFFGGIQCEITKISPFGGTNHYGVVYEVSELGESDRIESGWIPVELYDRHEEQLMRATQVRS